MTSILQRFAPASSAGQRFRCHIHPQPYHSCAALYSSSFDHENAHWAFQEDGICELHTVYVTHEVCHGMNRLHDSSQRAANDTCSKDTAMSTSAAAGAGACDRRWHSCACVRWRKIVSLHDTGNQR